jgi:H+/Cl- antiporter ClcA
MISALVSSISADFISKQFFGLDPVFNFGNIDPIPLNQYIYLVILGIIIGLMGIVFNKSLVFFQDLYSKQKWIRTELRPVIPFVLAGITGLYLPEMLGGGNGLVNSLISNNPSIRMLLIFLAVKFIFTMTSYGSSAPGGIFLPLLVIGALAGNIYSDIISVLFDFNQSYTANFIILAMAGYFTAIVKAPITGIILITEMTGSFSNLLSIGVVCVVSYIVTEILNSKPIYEMLLERILKKGNSLYEPNPNNKFFIEISVQMGSSLEGKKIKNIVWPANCLVVGIMRGGQEVIPNGETVILTGDYLTVTTNEDNADITRECLSKAAEEVV